MKECVQKLRRDQTEAERKLWGALRDRRFCHFKFRRQRIIGPYIIDFVCLKHRIIIEADGAQHLENKEYDDIRTQYLESCGYQVLRFWNNQILEELDFVLNVIYLTLIRPDGHLLPNWEKELHCKSSSTIQYEGLVKC